MIFLDHCSTTPMHPDVWEAMKPYAMEHFGNAGSLHRYGREARAAVESAKSQIAQLIHAEPDEIVLTSGGTEANLLAILGQGSNPLHSNGSILVSSIEHPSVFKAAARLAEGNDVRVVRVPVDRGGRLNMDAFQTSIADSNTIIRLVSVMHANHETGVIQPVEDIIKACRDRGILSHVDAVQSPAMVPIDVKAMGVDLLTLSAHKLNGPKGIGALYVRDGSTFHSRHSKKGSMFELKSGTENVCGIVGFGKACVLADRFRESNSRHCEELRNGLEASVLRRIPGTQIHGNRQCRLPHITNMGFTNQNAEDLIYAMDSKGVAVSSGATCSHGAAEASPVLLAMGLDHRAAQSALRFSVGSENTLQEMQTTVDILEEILKH